MNERLWTRMEGISTDVRHVSWVFMEYTSPSTFNLNCSHIWICLSSLSRALYQGTLRIELNDFGHYIAVHGHASKTTLFGIALNFDWKEFAISVYLVELVAKIFSSFCDKLASPVAVSQTLERWVQPLWLTYSSAYRAAGPYSGLLTIGLLSHLVVRLLYYR